MSRISRLHFRFGPSDVAAHRQSVGRRCGLRSAIAGCLAMVLPFAGCTFQRAYISYAEAGAELPLRATSFNGQALGVVRTSEGGAIWKECSTVAEASIWVLIQQTKALGGDAIGDIRWFPSEVKISGQEPVCKQKWGWILIWPILATPAFQRVRVEAVAYRVGQSTFTENIYLIPDTPAEQAELVRQVLSETLPAGS